MPHSIKKWFKYTFANTQTRMVLLLTIAVTILIFAVSLTSYIASKTVLQQELSEPQMQMLQINMSYVDEYIRASDHIAVQVALNSHVYHYLTDQQSNNYDLIAKIYELLTTLINNTDHVQSIYIYNVQRDSFVTIPQGYHSSPITFADSDWIDIIDEFGDQNMLVRKRVVPEGGKRMGSEITLFRKIIIRGELHGLIAINYDDSVLFSKLHPPISANLNSARYVIDQNGNLLYSTERVEEPEFIDSILNQLGEESLGDVNYGGQRLLASQLQSPLTGWKYISIVSQDKLLAKSITIRNIVLSVSIMSLLLGGIAIFYIHSVAFRPVRQMMNLFKSRNGELQQPDLEHLAKLTDELLSDHDQLARMVRQTMPEASSKFIHDYFSGHIHSLQEVEDKWNRYFPQWTDAPLTIAVVSIDDYVTWAERFPSKDHSLLKFALINVIAEVLSNDWRTKCIDFGKDKLIVLLQPASGKSLLTNQFAEAMEVVQRLLKFSISVGISTPQGNIRKLRQAMFEAENALSYRLYRGYQSVIPFVDVSDHEMADHVKLPLDIDEWIAAIEAGDTDRSTRMIERMIEDVRLQYWFPSAVTSSLKNISERLINLGADHNFDIIRIEMFKESLMTLPIEDIEKRLTALVLEIAQTFQSLVQSKDFQMCQRMIEYMKRHLSEPIGVQEIADYCGISVSLASQLFKQEMDETIYGYFTKLRMDRAAELLVQTDEKLFDIAKQVGYQHENSFIRVFRKYKDITPGKYREMMQKQSDSNAE